MSVLICIPSISIVSYLTLIYAVTKKRVDLYPSSICFAWFFAWFLFMDVCKQAYCLSVNGFQCYTGTTGQPQEFSLNSTIGTTTTTEMYQNTSLQPEPTITVGATWVLKTLQLS